MEGNELRLLEKCQEEPKIQLKIVSIRVLEAL